MQKIVSRNPDLLSGPIVKQMYRFVIPLAATSVLQQLFNVADTAVVGRFAGTEAMAAVGTNASIISLLVNLFTGIALGATVIIANSIGSGHLERIRKAVSSAVLFSFFGGLVMALFCEAFSSRIMASIGVPEDVFDQALLYLRIYLAGLPVIFLYNFEAAIFRATGDSRTPLIALTISGVINILLNLFFVIVLKADVAGVAIATVISNLVSSVILFVLLLKTGMSIRIVWKELRMDWNMLEQIIKIGLPAGLQSAMFSFANIIVQSSINRLGSVIMAGSAAAYNLEVSAYYILNAFGQTVTTFVSQNYGARNGSRCREILRKAFVHSYISTMSAAALIYVFSVPLLRMFTTDPEVIHYGQIRLIFIFVSYAFSVWQEMGAGYLRGFGLSAIPAYISIVGICATRILWITLVCRINPTFEKIMTVYPISLFITGFSVLMMVFVKKPTRKYGLTD